jgi:proteic killer suppression protein
MLRSFKQRWLHDFYVADVQNRNIPPDIRERLFRKLQLLDDATADSDLRVPPANHFEQLAGNLKGWHSIRVNQKWRLIFQWDSAKGEASDVYLDDHSYR